MPCKVGISAADIACGMYAYTGILTALLVREKTGQGVALETSLFDSLGEWMSYPMYYSFSGSAPARSGANHAIIAPYGPVTSGDNQTVYIGLQNEREWKKFCDAVLQKPELSADPRFDCNARRVQNRPQLDEAMKEVFDKLTAAEILARLDAAHIANARMNGAGICRAPAIESPRAVEHGGYADGPASGAASSRDHGECRDGHERSAGSRTTYRCNSDGVGI
jgi:crotonobetainyl-CoA:carnitine CoA-transferase CaiB-like acyl-CoA transferase